MLKVLAGKLLVEVPSSGPSMRGGLYIPETAQDTPIVKGVVVACSRDPISDFKGTHTPTIITGMSVWFPKFNSNKIEFEGKTLYSMNESDVLAFDLE